MLKTNTCNQYNAINELLFFFFANYILMSKIAHKWTLECSQALGFFFIERVKNR